MYHILIYCTFSIHLRLPAYQNAQCLKETKIFFGYFLLMKVKKKIIKISSETNFYELQLTKNLIQFSGQLKTDAVLNF